MSESWEEEIGRDEHADLHVDRQHLKQSNKFTQRRIKRYLYEAQKHRVMYVRHLAGAGDVIDEDDELHPALPLVRLIAVQHRRLKVSRVMSQADSATLPAAESIKSHFWNNAYFFWRFIEEHSKHHQTDKGQKEADVTVVLVRFHEQFCPVNQLAITHGEEPWRKMMLWIYCRVTRVTSRHALHKWKLRGFTTLFYIPVAHLEIKHHYPKPSQADCDVISTVLADVTSTLSPQPHAETQDKTTI